MNWARFPAFLPDRPVAVQVGWLYLLRAWHLGEDPRARAAGQMGLFGGAPQIAK